MVFDYTKCDTLATATYAPPSDALRRNIKEWKYDSSSKICTIKFSVVDEIPAPVYLYYRLTNFYQNNRKFVKSFDLKQLKGEAVEKPAAECAPLDRATESIPVIVNNVTVQSDANAIYYPCGLIANALFSDNIGNITCLESSFNFPNNGCKPSGPTVTYEFSSSGIAWPNDKQKYKESLYKNLPNLTTKVIPPPFWREAFPEYKDGYTAANLPNLENDERFHVWMRTAGLPTFRKLYGLNAQNKLPAGEWEIPISQSNTINKDLK